MLPFPRKPVIAMVHVQYAGSISRAADAALRDVDILTEAGVDGLLFENWGGEHEDRFAPAVRAYLPIIIQEAGKRTNLPLGINVLPLDYEAAFDIAEEAGCKFVQVDTLVDTVVTDYPSRFIIDIDTAGVLTYRKGSRVALLANIQTKHYKTLPEGKPLAESAKEAMAASADALVVTGEATGQRTPLDRVRCAKHYGPVFIGSGYGLENADDLRSADGVIVGSSLKVGGVTEHAVDRERAHRLMEAVARVRG